MRAHDWLIGSGVTVAIKSLGTTDKDGWECNAWEATLAGPDGTMTVPYYSGTAIQHDPTPSDIIDALARDARTLEITEDEPGVLNFDDWAEGLGYSADSREAEKVWREIQQQTNAVQSICRSAADFYWFLTVDEAE